MTELAESPSAAPEMAALINKGRPREVVRYYYGDQVSHADKADANFLFMVSLAFHLVGQGAIADSIRIQAAECKNYSRQMEGDFHRDAAIMALKTGAVELAARELDEAASIHDGDPNREAAIWMVRGRIEFANGRYDAALHDHDVADDIWLGLEQDGKPFDAQWVLNNRYHRLRAAVYWLPSAAKVGRSDYRYVMKHSKDRRQRIGARFARFAGSEGVEAFDSIMLMRST